MAGRSSLESMPLGTTITWEEFSILPRFARTRMQERKTLPFKPAKASLENFQCSTFHIKRNLWLQQIIKPRAMFPQLKRIILEQTLTLMKQAPFVLFMYCEFFKVFIVMCLTLNYFNAILIVFP